MSETEERYYVIFESDAVFFSDRNQAESFQEENYYLCTGDVKKVPEGAKRYTVVDRNGLVFCLFSGDNGGLLVCDKEIKVKVQEDEESTKINLCDTCRNHPPECFHDDLKFGDGMGLDNIISCHKYERSRCQY